MKNRLIFILLSALLTAPNRPGLSAADPLPCSAAQGSVSGGPLPCSAAQGSVSGGPIPCSAGQGSVSGGITPEEFPRRVFRVDPDHGEATGAKLLALGRFYLSQGSHERAARVLDQALRLLPREGELLFPWGEPLAHSPLAGARDRFRQDWRARATRANPDRVEGWLLLGNAWGKLGRWFSARKAWTRAVDLAPRFAPAHLALGVAHYKTDRLRKAVASFREAVRLEPAFSQAHLCLALALARLGRDAPASEALREAKRLNPIYYQTHFFLGLVFNGLRDRKPIDPFQEYLYLPSEVPDVRLLHDFLKKP